MKIKTTELKGTALDWAVAKCEKQKPSSTTGEPFLYEHRVCLQDFIPSTNWAQGGPIIEKEKIELSVDRSDASNKTWYATIEDEEQYLDGEGRTPLIAAMRCYVASKLGAEVEIPNELIGE